jgi:hypothetical protein
MARKSALSREPGKPQTGGGLTQSLQRLSPGVYRNAGGQLTNQAGRPMPQQPNRMPPPQGRPGMVNLPGQMRPDMTPGGVAGAISGAFNGQRPQGPATDPGFFGGAMNGQPQYGNLPGQYPPGYGPESFNNAVTGQGGLEYQQWAMDQQRAPAYNRPPQPPQQMQPQQLGMQMQYGMTGKPIGWGWGQNQS